MAISSSIDVIPDSSRRLTSNVWFRFACLLSALMLLMLFGVLGLGHGGPASTTLDARILYLAGLHWRDGLSAYQHAALIPVASDLKAAAAAYDFAYPPHIAPLCLFLSAFSWHDAKLFMIYLNVAATLCLGLVAAGVLNDDRMEPWAAKNGRTKGLVAALVIGNFSTAYVVWAGQTTLIVAAALLAGWCYMRRGMVVMGGILIGIATIKPQLMLGVLFWLLLERRWKIVVIAAATALAMAIVPILISGPVGLLRDWYSAVSHYTNASYNFLGSRMVFGVPSLLQAIDLPIPHIGPVLMFISVMALWYFRHRILDADILALLLGITLLFGYAHGYDLVVLAPMVPAFWRHLEGRPQLSAVALGLFLIITLPNSILEPFGISLLVHGRVLALLVCVVWLCLMSIKRTARTRRDNMNDKASIGAINRASISQRVDVAN
ncbi:MAG: glycosyltransferase family 87 protein [Pseudomonadota bacterium]